MPLPERVAARFLAASEPKVARIFRAYPTLEENVKHLLHEINETQTYVQKALGGPLGALNNDALNELYLDVQDSFDEIQTILGEDVTVVMARTIEADAGLGATPKVLRGVEISKGMVERNLLRPLQTATRSPGLSDEAKFAFGQAVRASQKMLATLDKMKSLLSRGP